LHELEEETPRDHHLVAGAQARRNLVSVCRLRTEGYMPSGKAAIGLGEVDERQVLVIVQDCGDRHEQSSAFVSGVKQHADIHLLAQSMLWVLDDHPHGHRARIGVYQS